MLEALLLYNTCGSLLERDAGACVVGKLVLNTEEN